MVQMDLRFIRNTKIIQHRSIKMNLEETTTETITQVPDETGTDNPIDFPVVEDTIEMKLEQALAQASEMKDAWLRAKAETENVRRRSMEDAAKARKYALESFAEDLLAVKDSLEMALQAEALSQEGIELTLKQLTESFTKHKIVEVNPKVGAALDPNKHQAITAVESEQEENTIVTTMQKGYMIADRLLRPAMVTVAKKKEENE
jgi:molecular chaperone GrpE